MEQIAEIAARIRELREACGYTQEELAKKLGIDVAVLRAYEENGYNIPGYDFEDLAFRFTHKIMQPLRVHLLPDDEKPALITHSGQEFNLVLEGKVKVLFEDKELILEEGDSIYFNPLHPHGQVCADDKPAVFLTVIAE